jgi:uncharacterized glyoxalase superfamily protein PhnB
MRPRDAAARHYGTRRRRGPPVAFGREPVAARGAYVDHVHSGAVSRGLNIVYPLTNEPWGVRRFFVIDPSGTIINVMCHIGGTH